MFSPVLLRTSRPSTPCVSVRSSTFAAGGAAGGGVTAGGGAGRGPPAQAPARWHREDLGAGAGTLGSGALGGGVESWATAGTVRPKAPISPITINITKRPCLHMRTLALTKDWAVPHAQMGPAYRPDNC